MIGCYRSTRSRLRALRVTPPCVRALRTRGSRLGVMGLDRSPFFFRSVEIDMNDEELEIIVCLLLASAIIGVIALWYLLAQIFNDSPGD